jgi:hypothetical protein
MEELYCGYNYITDLGLLTENFTHIICVHNQLTHIPLLPPKIKYADFENNNISLVTSFPSQIEYINCGNNCIQVLPEIPNTVGYFQCNDNPIYDVIGNSDENDKIIDNANIIHNFRFTYYIIKLKSKFKKWLWEYVRQPKIKKLFSPENLLSQLSQSQDNGDLDSLLMTIIIDFENKLYNTV